MTFSNLGLSAPLLSVLEETGLSAPTPVQKEAIPLLLGGNDVLALSQTGSGKTAAFALPVLERIELERRQVQALVLCPTRELAGQVAGEFRRLGRRLPSFTVLGVAGGSPVRFQADALARGAHVVVGTPGRVGDLIARRALELAGVRTVVLDEADRMLDMGFRERVREILAHLPDGRQVALFSATFPPEVEALALDVMQAPKRVVPLNDASPSFIEHELLEVRGERVRTLAELLLTEAPRSSVVFCNRKQTSADVAAILRRHRIDAEALHGDLEQRDRERVLARFRNESMRVLVATDVAARGLDVETVDLVCHYELALSPDAYVHRCGRTGRAGRRGRAVTLFEPGERAQVDGILLASAGVQARAYEPGSGLKGEALEAPMRTLTLWAGRKSKLRPGDVLGALTGESGGFEASVVGKIEIHERHAWVALERGVASRALAALRQHGIKGRTIRVELD